MSKEQLEDDKAYIRLFNQNTKLSKRVKELEKTNRKNYWIAADFKFENLKLEQQNKRYCEAIEKIKDYNRKALKVGNYTENEALLDISLEIRKLEESQ